MRRAGTVGQLDLIDVDVSPRAGFGIDDFEVACLPARFRTFQLCHASCSAALPVAVRTIWPSTSRLMQVRAGVVSAADEKRQKCRLISNGGEVSLPCG